MTTRFESINGTTRKNTYIYELVDRDSEELGAENADPAFYHIYFNKAGRLGKKVV